MYIATYNCIKNMRNQLTEVIFPKFRNTLV